MDPLFTADPSHPAIMAQSGVTITHGQLEARANKIAHLLRAMGLKRSDHYAVFMENHPRYIECGIAGERAGLYYTNVNSYLTPGELAYIVNNSLSQVLITSRAHLAIALRRGQHLSPGMREPADHAFPRCAMQRCLARLMRRWARRSRRSFSSCLAWSPGRRLRRN